MKKLADSKALDPAPLTRVIFILLLSFTLAGCATGGALMNASDQGQTSVIKDLLDKGADLNERGVCGARDSGGDIGVTPLYCAAHGGHLEAVKLLVSKGADVNAVGMAFHRTPLMATAYAHHAGIAEFLIENGADVDYAMEQLKTLNSPKDQYDFLEKIIKEQGWTPKHGTSPSRLPTALPLPTESAAPF